MASKSLYDILEVSPSASLDSIRASYERLSASYSKGGADADADLRTKAIAEAFLTLSNPDRRAQYDKKLAIRLQPVSYTIEDIEPFWTMPKLVVLALIVIVGGSFFYNYKKEEARLEAEKVIATAKAKEAEVKAKAEAEQAQLELDKQRELALQEERQRRERDAALRQLSFERQRNEVMNSTVTTRQAMQDRIAQDRQRREEAHEAAAVRQRLAAEKAELCRKERERYGRTISC